MPPNSQPAANRLELSITEPIEIEIDSKTGFDVYLTRVEDVRGDIITIAAPMQKGDMVPLGRGEWVHLRAKRKDAIFSARGQVREVRWTPFAAIVVELGGDWKRQQRRADVRLEVSIEPDSVEAVMPDGVCLLLPFGVRNLSVGGALLVSRRFNRHSPQGIQLATDIARIKAAIPVVTLNLRFPLSGDFVLACMASVVRIEAVEDGNDQFYRLAVAFAELNPRQEDAVFRFIFAQQREQRQRGVA